MDHMTGREQELADAARADLTVLASGAARVGVITDAAGRQVLTITMEPGPFQGRCAVISAIAAAFGTSPRWASGAYRATARTDSVMIEASYRPPDLLPVQPDAADEAVPVMAGAAA